MKGEELKIVFKEDMAFLTKEVALDFKQVDISDSPVKFKANAFWTVRVLNYKEEEKKLFVEVIDYQVGETEFSYNQIQLSDILLEVEEVKFKSIYTLGLLKTIDSTLPIKILPPKKETIDRHEPQKKFEIANEREPIHLTYNEPFSVHLKNVTFLLGSVTFEKKMQHFKKRIQFEIFNDSIIKEYDSIKNYFASVLQTKKIQVVPTIITVDGIITSVNATSIEIEKIDKSLVEEVKFEIVKVARRKDSTVDKQLFTMEEYLETFAGEDFKTQQLFKDENEFFNNLIERSETKHYNQLRFLSSKQKHDIQKLRFVHKPFSFVFLLSGTDKFYIVWETLDTEEATYIWTIANDENNLKHVLAIIDKTINHIIKEGKSDYISQNEENFKRVFHDYKDVQNGFKNWRAGIESVII